MLFSKQTVLFLGCLLGAATAIQVADVQVPGITMPETEEGLLLIHYKVVYDVVDGTNQTSVLAYYVDADPINSTLPLTTSPNNKSPLSKKVCGSNNVSCYSSNQANQTLCNGLVNNLARSGANVPYSPRSICLFGGGCGCTCCVSWANPVPAGTAQQFQLANAADKVLSQCSSSSGVSGLTRNTLIGDTCTTQCLSDRSTGCE